MAQHKKLSLNDPASIKHLQASYFKKFDSLLDKPFNEPYWLKQDAVADIVTKSLHFNTNKEYKLEAFCIMSNHVHLVITTLETSIPLYAILQKHKRFTAWQANKVLKRSGSFWQNESYNHVIRNDKEWHKVICYIIDNPVKAGQVGYWK